MDWNLQWIGKNQTHFFWNVLHVHKLHSLWIFMKVCKENHILNEETVIESNFGWWLRKLNQCKCWFFFKIFWRKYNLYVEKYNITSALKSWMEAISKLTVITEGRTSGRKDGHWRTHKNNELTSVPIGAMKCNFFAHLGNYDRPTNRPAEQTENKSRPTERSTESSGSYTFEKIYINKVILKKSFAFRPFFNLEDEVLKRSFEPVRYLRNRKTDVTFLDEEHVLTYHLPHSFQWFLIPNDVTTSWGWR